MGDGPTCSQKGAQRPVALIDTRGLTCHRIMTSQKAMSCTVRCVFLEVQRPLARMG